jgi:hypothetical protein
MVRYIKATDLTSEQRQRLEEAITNDADGERRWSAEALSPDHAVLFRKDGKSLSISCRYPLWVSLSALPHYEAKLARRSR